MGFLPSIAACAHERFAPNHEGDRKHQGVARDRHDRQQRPPKFAVGERGVDFLLGQKAEEQRQSSHRERRQQAGGKSHRHGSSEPAQAADIARTGFVVDQPGNHEQRTLEHRMRDQVEHRRFDRLVGPETGQHHEQPQRAHRCIGEHQFQIGLPDRKHCSHDKGRSAENRQDCLPLRRTAKHRVEPHHQIDAGLHHCRRVQVGGDWRRRLHGVRQPEMERKLRRFRECTAQYKDKRQKIKRAFPQRVA